jgi:hypothetical protein
MGLQSVNLLLQVQSSVQCNTVYNIQNKILSDTIHRTSKWIAIFILVNFVICVLHPSYKIKIADVKAVNHKRLGKYLKAKKLSLGPKILSHLNVLSNRVQIRLSVCH